MSIQSEINRIAGAKSDIADAIEDMGGTLSPGASIDDLAAGVRTIPQGPGGTTDANDVTYDSSETYDSGTVGAALNEQRNTLNHKADAIYDTASGAIASFPDGADGLPVKDLTVAIEPVQSGTGDPSPINVRSISGWTGVNVSKAGKNLYSSGDILLGGDNERTATVYIDTIPAGTYYLSTAVSSVTLAGSYGFQFFDANGTKVGDGSANSHFTLTGDAVRIYAYMNTTDYNNGKTVLFKNIQIVADIDTISATFPEDAGTVYGGTLNVTTGVLTVDWVMIVADGVNVKCSGEYGPDAEKLPAINISDNKGLVPKNIISSYLKYASSPEYTRNSICMFNGGNFIALHIDDIQGIGSGQAYQDMSALEAAANAFLQDNNLQIAYKLATPQTYQLTPTEVTTLLGQNNIWSDCGPVSVEYPADTKLYIQKINTPTDDDMIADTNISSGKYFIVGNSLYLSTTAILAGDPIKPGTNCTLTNLAAALNALNS